MPIERVATFSEFTADNDQHGEHDSVRSSSLAGNSFFEPDY
jgi:hypothetical protein